MKYLRMFLLTKNVRPIDSIFLSRDSSILDKLAAKSPRLTHYLFPTTLPMENVSLLANMLYGPGYFFKNRDF